MKFPSFLIVGSEKSGTTTLYSHLRQHPDIFLPDVKEIHFFNEYTSTFIKNDIYCNKGVKWYKSFFNTDKSVVGEVTPMYLCDSKAPERIHETLPNIKILIILRNPVYRAYSHYWMAKWKKDIDKTFEEVINERNDMIIKRGLYYNQVLKYIELFGLKNIKVLFFEDYKHNPKNALSDVFNFLSVTDYSQLVSSYVIKNRSNSPKSVLLLKIIRNTTFFLRKRISAGLVVDFFKRIGIANLIKSLNKSECGYPNISDKNKNNLIDYYKDDVRQLGLLLDVDLLQKWGFNENNMYS